MRTNTHLAADLIKRAERGCSESPDDREINYLFNLLASFSHCMDFKSMISSLRFPLTCFDAVCASSASCAEGATPAVDGRHRSVRVAADPAVVTVAGRGHRVAVGGVGQPRGVGHPRTQQLGGARHPTGA